MKKQTNWKLIAIIFIVLFGLTFIALAIETSVVLYFVNLGVNSVNQDIECAYNICDGYDTYYYDLLSEVCSCYIDHELAKEIYVG